MRLSSSNDEKQTMEDVKIKTSFGGLCKLTCARIELISLTTVYSDAVLSFAHSLSHRVRVCRLPKSAHGQSHLHQTLNDTNPSNRNPQSLSINLEARNSSLTSTYHFPEFPAIVSRRSSPFIVTPVHPTNSSERRHHGHFRRAPKW